MRVRTTTRLIVRVVLCCGIASLLAWGQSQAPTGPEIVSRMEQAQAASRAHMVPYSVVRQYQLSAADAQHPNSTVIAQVNFVPPSQKDYAIIDSTGSDRGESIVRKVLEHESQMASHPDTHDINSQNYSFTLIGRQTLDGRDCYVLQITPRREARELLNGKVWIDANSFLIRQIEGSPVKSPSFWIKNLTLTISYGEVSGVWVAQATKAVAEVRFIGTHVLTSRDLDLQTGTVNALNQSPRWLNRRHNAQPAVSDTASWVAR